ncbi:uncharacterized protein EV420DRAFT_1616767 [Desarmillaria tabescens]|uniref:Topoisomerase I damage affected protein 2 n=1 Tax=Armillaria tabescens TaxID=1929756 RepID=A0AA39U6N0_ARMTA|nr:uncharacterized protein EV420DRAFT_1616767 [Desarmillaria tabescens]KAK0468045.1 hypothetical protein EV420DRAFT_1616767 [Desarmillaria tabescens]
MANPAGLRSPPTPRSEVSSPRPKFDAELLKAYMKKLMSTTLHSAVWPEPRERDRRVKERMVEIQKTGFKYIVLTQINENLGQGGRADMVCHWEDSDVVAQEVFSNDSVICICIAFAVRTV